MNLTMKRLVGRVLLQVLCLARVFVLPCQQSRMSYFLQVKLQPALLAQKVGRASASLPRTFFFITLVMLDCWLGSSAELQCCAERKEEAQEAKSCQSEFQGCFPLFMTEMKRRKTRASEWKGQILLFSAFLLFLDCSEENNLPSQSSALSHA